MDCDLAHRNGNQDPSECFYFELSPSQMVTHTQSGIQGRFVNLARRDGHQGHCELALFSRNLIIFVFSANELCVHAHVAKHE